MPGAPEATVVMPKRWKEVVWALVPAIGLVLILFATWRAIHPAAMDMSRMPAGHRMIDQ